MMIFQYRLVKAALARRSTDDCFVIGSSQTFFLDAKTAPDLFQDCRAVTNLAVTLGGFEDFVALSGVLAEKGDRAHVYLGMTPWIFRDNPDHSWTEYREIYERGRLLLGLAPQSSGARSLPPGFATLLSGNYALYNLQQFLASDRGRPALSLDGIEAETANADEAIILPNGRIVHPPVEPPLASTIGDGGSNIEAPEIDAEKTAEFETALSSLLHRGHEITLLMTPYHPVVMECKNARVCDTLRKVETKTREIGARFGVAIVGSFDPRPFALAWRDFLDDMHLGLSGLPKLKPIAANPWLVARREK